jgi:hypothetical protein
MRNGLPIKTLVVAAKNKKLRELGAEGLTGVEIARPGAPKATI